MYYKLWKLMSEKQKIQWIEYNKMKMKKRLKNERI